MWLHLDCRGAFFNVTVIKVPLCKCFLMESFWHQHKIFYVFFWAQKLYLSFFTWMLEFHFSFLHPTIRRLTAVCRWPVLFIPNTKCTPRKKNQTYQILLLDSFLNSNTNTFYKSCMCVHIYLIYCTVDFSFQSFAQFLFFLLPHRSWYSISRTLTNAGL